MEAHVEADTAEGAYPPCTATGLRLPTLRPLSHGLKCGRAPPIPLCAPCLLQEDAPPSDHSKWCEWVKARWRAFNTGLEAVYAVQTGWSVPDARLRASVRGVAQQVTGGGGRLHDVQIPVYRAGLPPS